MGGFHGGHSSGGGGGFHGGHSSSGGGSSRGSSNGGGSYNYTKPDNSYQNSSDEESYEGRPFTPVAGIIFGLLLFIIATVAIANNSDAEGYVILIIALVFYPLSLILFIWAFRKLYKDGVAAEEAKKKAEAEKKAAEQRASRKPRARKTTKTKSNVDDEKTIEILQQVEEALKNGDNVTIERKTTTTRTKLVSCPNCNTMVNVKAKFCPSCGAQNASYEDD
ncbi:MAG: zinc ribbon domain-containing protein [Acholeplasmatales bacterium]|nr:zinc ribbon domain-containing protein [Acholeplasmatales bacterium]